MPVPKWLLRAIAGSLPIFEEFWLEVQDTIQDWGLYADICRYHKTDRQLTSISTRIRVLQAKEEDLGPSQKNTVLYMTRYSKHRSTCQVISRL